MIKAVFKIGDKGRLVMLGLSGENITRLIAGEPILFSGAELGFPDTHISILYGRTEEDIRHEISTQMKVQLPPTVGS